MTLEEKALQSWSFPRLLTLLLALAASSILRLLPPSELSPPVVEAVKLPLSSPA